MIYLPEELELLLKSTMKTIGFKRNSGNLEINEYEVQNLKTIDYCDSSDYLFDVVMIFEEKNIKLLFKKEFKTALNQNFAVQNMSLINIENNRVQVAISCTQNI